MNLAKTQRMVRRWGGVLCVHACLGFGAAGWAQDPASSNVPNVASVAMPPLPEPKPFTEWFRKLLEATPAEREKLLAARSTPSRAVLEKKIHEYEALPNSKREIKLSALDLRWYLTTLIPMSPRQRADWIARMPEKDREPVRERLAEWDRWPEKLKDELQSENRGATVLARMAVSSTDMVSTLKIPEIPRIERAVADWRTLPTPQRVLITEHVLATQAKQSPFTGLSEAQRDACLRAFQTYTRMSTAERSRFLHNAERWRTMSPQERELWRKLTIPPVPPLPPDGSSPAFKVRGQDH